MLSVLYELYYRVKTYFNTMFNINNNVFDFTKINEITKEKILILETEINVMYNDINEKYMYKMLKKINDDFDTTTPLNKVIDYLEEESIFILQNKDNLEVSINEIKQNTHVLELIRHFKILQEIDTKKNEIKKLYK
jgi:hypothetical protein